MTWRLLTDDSVAASAGLATDEALAQRVGKATSPPTLRLYTYRSHCALVGRFQTVEHEVHVDFCRDNDIAIGRRPTGGGAIIMGAGQLGVALTLAGRARHAYGGARQLMERFSKGLVEGLARLGIGAEFRHKNDLEVDDRKIAGLGIYRHHRGGLLFHASLLVDLDVPLMLQVLRIPLSKIADKGVTSVAARTSTVHRELGAPIALAEVREAVAAGYASSFGVELDHGGLDSEERETIEGLERAKYDSEEWTFQRGSVPDRHASASIKTPAGVVDIGVALAGRTLKAVHIGGDFFASDNAIADLEGALRWHPGDRAAIRNTLREVYRRRHEELELLPLEYLEEAIVTAVGGAAAGVPETAGATAGPYGCFVSPGDRHA